MRTRTGWCVRLSAALAFALTGCAADEGAPSDVRDSGPVPESRERAREVAAAWDGSPAATAWREGYQPLDDELQVPRAAERAGVPAPFRSRDIVLAGDLPEESPLQGEMTWKGGGSLTVPLMTAREAYEDVDHGGRERPRLTVTRVEPGTMKLVTNHGLTTVPAWLFTLEGHDTPVRRAAVDPTALPEPPIRPVEEESDGLAPLEGLVEVSADGRTVVVRAGHGACDDGPAVSVVETGGSVVLFASVVGRDGGMCTKQLIVEEMRVELRHPLGERVLLDAFTGEPLTRATP